MTGLLYRLVVRVKHLRGFVTVPGLISLGGVLLAGAMLMLDWFIDGQSGLTIPDFLTIPSDNARPILIAVAGSTMTALSLVYSSVLVVFTLAAGNIGPRLLLRFSSDRTNQIAVGTLGGTFLYSLIIIRNQYKGHSVDLSVNVGLLLAALCVVMLLFFVNSAAKRVTIDEEVASIGDTLDEELSRAIAAINPVNRADVVRPTGREYVIATTKAGYINRINYLEIAKIAAKHKAFIDFDVVPGSYVIEGQKLALVLSSSEMKIREQILPYVVLGRSRSSEEDLVFSVSLLVEIALRALSPGINDTFTAIACADRLSAALSRARCAGLSSGVYTGPDGAVRVTAPNLTIDDLVAYAFDPLRRAARDNVLMTRHIVLALGRLGLGKNLPGEDAVRRQLELVREGARAGDLLEADMQRLEQAIDHALDRQVGWPLPGLEGQG